MHDTECPDWDHVSLNNTTQPNSEWLYFINAFVFLGLEAEKYTTPTLIQKQSIGYALQGKDILGAAKTGSGKNTRLRYSCKYSRWF